MLTDVASFTSAEQLSPAVFATTTSPPSVNKLPLSEYDASNSIDPTSVPAGRSLTIDVRATPAGNRSFSPGAGSDWPLQFEGLDHCPLTEPVQVFVGLTAVSTTSLPS